MKEEHRPVARDELEEDIEQALWKARKLLPHRVEPGNFNPYKAAHRAGPINDLRAWIERMAMSRQPRAVIMDSRWRDECRAAPPAVASRRE